MSEVHKTVPCAARQAGTDSGRRRTSGGAKQGELPLLVKVLRDTRSCDSSPVRMAPPYCLARLLSNCTPSIVALHSVSANSAPPRLAELPCSKAVSGP